MKKLNLTQLLFWIFATLLSTFALCMLFSCDTAKQSQKGYDKFIKHGGKFECEPTIITLHDTIKGKDGKDSIVEKLVTVPCPKVETPKTRFEIRFDNKRFDDSLDFIKAKYSDSLKYALKSNKTDSKTQIKIEQELTKRIEEQTKQNRDFVKGNVKTAFPWEWLFVLLISIVILIFLKWKR